MSTDAAALLGAEGLTPLLVCDMWEHAYYLDHARQDYLAAWWKLINWDFAARQLVAKFGAVMAI